MDITNHLSLWFNMIDRPVFCVKSGKIIAANSAAQHRMLCTGMDIFEIVGEHRDAYEAFESGCLYLTITAGGLPCDASVTRTDEYDIFLILQDAEDERLQALALAAQQLRIPLSTVMTEADRLLAGLDTNDPDTVQQAKHINRGLFQLLRIIVNMSDANRYQNDPKADMENVNLSSLVNEVLEKIRSVASGSGVQIQYTAINEFVFGLANSEKLERAIHNLLSNAIKFAEPGTVVDVSLTRNGNRLAIAVTNTGTAGAAEHSFWNQYRREPAIEDSRCGLGLGMTLVRSVASAHGGTVLVDHPANNETRVTMTIAITKKSDGDVHSPVIRLGDYAGGRDRSLLELSDILPTESYEKIN